MKYRKIDSIIYKVVPMYHGNGRPVESGKVKCFVEYMAEEWEDDT